MFVNAVVLNYGKPISLDIQTFEAGIDTQDIATLREAADLYRGDFLQGFYVKDAVDFDEWMIAHREHLRERMMTGMEKLVNQAINQGNYTDGVVHARRLLELDPWRESAHRKLMGLLSRQGQYAAALAQYEKCRQTLLNELGVEPMPETTLLFERIHAARSIQPHSLPAEREPFIGRKPELARLRDMLSNPTCRLVTLVGFGGMGKTRLALAVAREINREGALRFINGVVFISLADVTEPGGLPLALVAALEISLMEQTQASRALINYLKNKEILLVLDNFEQLLEGANLLTEILNTCPHVKLLVTSREPLQLAAEWRLDLEGLTYPGEDETWEATKISHYDAIHMFIQAARQVQVDYELKESDLPHVQRLCKLVGGMPLALKLAAGWVRVMPVSDIIAEVERCLDVLTAQMRDLPPRQRSIRAVLDSTWHQLSREEQEVFQALSTFRGGFTREAAGKVAGAKLLTFAKLVEKSLVQPTGKNRYGMHELLRQFSSGKLVENKGEETACLTRHSAHHLAFLNDRTERLIGKEQQTALAEIWEEIENIRAAWRWAVLQEDVDAIRPVIDVFYNFHQIRSHFQEGEEIFGWTVTRWQQTNRLRQYPGWETVLARLSARWGAFRLALYDYESAQECLRATLTLSDQPEERAFALSIMGRIAISQGDRRKAEEFLNESYQISCEMDDLCGMAEALYGLANAAVEFGDFPQAKESASQSLEISRKLERPDWIARSLGTLAWATNCLGGYRESETYWKESLAIQQENGDHLGVAINHSMLGWVAWSVSGTKITEAITLYEQALATYRARGYRDRLAMCLADLALWPCIP